ncbi:CHAT domain-containing protein [Actinoplanes sp. NPDC026619]|uniref:CHAT domain-containing protein n=1 Tax=Actinoplanes sp. NPDC026619 TaxID=3155798 RepID=UPI0033DF1B47
MGEKDDAEGALPPERLLQACRTILSAHESGELGTLLFQNPVLVGVFFRATLRAADHSSADPRIAATREVLAGFEADLRERRTTWKIGGGPLETLWLSTGVTIDEEAAVREAGSAAMRRVVSEHYVGAFAGFVQAADPSNPHLAIVAAQLIDAAVGHLEHGHPVRLIGAHGSVELNLLGLRLIGDFDAWDRAVDLAGDVVAVARAAADEAVLAGAVLLLGRALVEPVVLGRSLADLGSTRRWLEKNIEDLFVRSGGRLPAVKDYWRIGEKLRRGRSALDEAAGLLHGVQRAWAVALLVRTRYWLHLHFKEPLDTAGIVRDIDQALDDIGTADVETRIRLLAERCTVDHTLIDPDVQFLRTLDLLQVERRSGLTNALAAALSLLGVLTATGSDAVDLAASTVFLYPRLAERPAQQLLQAQLYYLFVPVMDKLTTSMTESSLLRAAEEESWDPIALARGRLALAMTPGVDITVKREALRLASAAFEDRGLFRPALAFARAVQDSDIAAEALQKRDVATFIELNTQAMLEFLALRWADAAAESVTVIRRGLDHLGMPANKALLEHVAPWALAVETSAGEYARVALQQIWAKAVADSIAAGDGMDILELFQLAKGARLAAALRNSPVLLDRRRDESLFALADSIRSVSEDRQEVIAAASDLEMVVVSAYDDRPVRSANNVNTVYRANVERTFESRLQRLLHAPPVRFHVRNLNDLADELPRDSVLWSIYFAKDERGRNVLYSVVLGPRREPYIAYADAFNEIPHWSITSERRKFELRPLELFVYSVRSLVNADARRGEVASSLALQTLATCLDSYFPNVADILDAEYAAGARHLVIEPHGPLHQFPFHLLAPAGRPLADTWTISYLPCLELLATRRWDVPARERRLESFGISFAGDPRGLPVLRGARDEASDVAAAMGETAVLDGEVTKQRFRRALRRSRYVHLATHGRHLPDSPSLHRLYLAPDDADGTLAAYEVLDLDLRGLEVVSLSACETSLGRIDTSGNQRGVTASLLMAGAASVLGTIWNVSDGAAKLFFTEFYRALADGGVAPMSCFRHAQLRTRQEFPRYRDWAAFVLTGDWRQGGAK